MPMASESQRRLMHAAANTPGGAGGVSQSTGREFAESDRGGQLPEKKGRKNKFRKAAKANDPAERRYRKS